MSQIPIRLSVRQAETVARFLRDTYKGKISASVCRWKSPYEVAVMYLGSKASKTQLNSLEKEIMKTIGIEVKNE